MFQIFRLPLVYYMYTKALSSQDLLVKGMLARVQSLARDDSMLAQIETGFFSGSSSTHHVVNFTPESDKSYWP